ncbi:MAG TPA: cation:proton antiporter [Gaiellaceae bacterium]|nr:cation:proton antiporter [Gaiellaceae bacterium]
MGEITHFGLAILIVSAIVAVAVLSNRVSEQVPIPAPAIFLLAAAVTVHFWPSIGREISVLEVERVAVVALILILFDGGMRVGWARFRVAAIPITVLGVFGTFTTAGLLALVGHYLFDFSWTGAGMLGAALAPTDPAVMFSVLGRHEVSGRTGTILEGESGVNDPVGIALMIGMIELATHADATFWVVVREFLLEMSIGLLVGVAGAWLILQSLRRIHLANPALYPLRSLAAAGVIYGVAAVAHGSGFLAVFVAGLLIGDAEYPGRRDVERFHTSLASLAEVVVFVGLGVTVHEVNLQPVWTDGLMIALILAFLARPLGIAAFLVPLRLRLGERVFLMWSGLKGAVPILLAAFALIENAPGSHRLYGIVFVVVAFSVIVQGGSVPFVARRLGVPMRLVHRGPP